LGLSKIRLMTNNPAKRVGIEGYGLEVVERIPLKAPLREDSLRYMETKRDRMGHLLDENETSIGRASAGLESISLNENNRPD
jgi:3,4-dihydroxy 2-butanone 4-phosphate synthase / GTP cyclohydrolase II